MTKIYDSETVQTLSGLLSAKDLSREQINHLLQVARVFSLRSKINEPGGILKGKTIVNLFFENSTRTRVSFEAAIRKLGANALNFAASTSSTKKGETLLDTARNIQAMNPDGIILRHSSSGTPLLLSQALRLPIINAGDGCHEHPTQALLDAFTLEERFGSVEGKRILILGDVLHSRVARSNIWVLNKLGAQITLCGPPTFLPSYPENWGVEVTTDLNAALPKANAVMALRVQLERQNELQLPSLSEYREFWGLTSERAQLLKKDACVLHPGPINRGVEIDSEVADGDQSVILDQVTHGIWVRMAVLAEIFNPKGLREWLAKEIA